jgi:hypothetical protein
MLMASPDYKCAAKDDPCREENLPLLRVILPWKTRPANSPQASPLWDGLRDAQVQIGNFDLIPPPTLLDGAKVKFIGKIKLAINPGQSIQASEPKVLSPAELHRLYAGTSVPQHRYLAPSLFAAVNSPEIAPHPAKWLAEISEVNLPSVVNAWLNTNSSTDYEQLYCIGLDPDTGQLTGVLKVKRDSGYSGGPSTAGSREYIAFWVDWGSGLEYQGTASVDVHDFSCLPPAGLEYKVSLPVDIPSHAQPSSEAAKPVKVRAVLSWNTPPSTTDPYAPVVWGNNLECRIPIPPGRPFRAGNRVPSVAGGGAGRIIDAAIQALTGMAFGPYGGLAVEAESAMAGPGATDWSFTIDTTEMEKSGYSFTLCVWNQTNGFPQKQTGSASRRGFRLQP